MPLYFSPKTVDAVLEANVERPLAYSIIATLWHTGLRCVELLRLKEENILWESGIIEVRPLCPGEDARCLHVDPNFMDSLKEWHSTRHQNLNIPDNLRRYVFPIGRGEVIRATKEAFYKVGITGEIAHPMTLRHSYAIHKLRNGTPPLTLYELMGMRSHAMLQKYMAAARSEIEAWGLLDLP